MQTPVNRIVHSLAFFYRMSGNLSFIAFSFLLASVLFMPFNAQAKDKILSLDMCTDWLLARYANPAQVLALSPLAYQYPLDWMDKKLVTHDGSIEQILDLKPDLVITGEYNAILLRQRLQELGLKVEILGLPKNLSQAIDYEKHLLALIGQTSNSNPTQPLSQSQKNNDKPRLLLLGANGIGTGRGTFENDILTSAGWKNYLQEEGYITLDLEKITFDPPDAVLWTAPASVALSNLFARHPALKKAIPDDRWLTSTAWKWRCPGPWTWDLINDLHASKQIVNQS